MECDIKSCALALNPVPAPSDKIRSQKPAAERLWHRQDGFEYTHDRVPYTGHSGKCPVGTMGHIPLQKLWDVLPSLYLQQILDFASTFVVSESIYHCEIIPPPGYPKTPATVIQGNCYIWNNYFNQEMC